MESSVIQVTPFTVDVDGVKVQVVEVSKQTLVTGETWYIVSVRVNYKGVESRVFPLFVRDSRDLKNKLKVEITKLKIIEASYGLQEVRRVIS
jgi:hypothetical protein